MIVLGIDTSTRFASVAIVQDGIVLAESTGDGRGHGSDLLVLIDAVCVGAAIGAHDLDAVAVGAGPGSFTGLRIGMATAKGIAFAAKCPLWAVSSLAALAHDVLLERELALIVAVLDARKGEVYTGTYRRDDDRTTLLDTERVMPPDDLDPPFGSRIVGDFVESFEGHDVVYPVTPSGKAVALLALEGTRVDVLVGGAPTYIRPSEAEVKYPDGVPGALKKR
ncbi:MAG TPA: tRNA (adenosine(37)-N6)-threonylcarbamoyltransferase complex dimerization subunit type 1 TsaB [Kofleriaceae bacterium]|nr:tRNA (adenosine(37)-N6)-threonylcarbamoyltransferase complex dimerization subunit type 1 TsaB [Kofleriaceae bacterium]